LEALRAAEESERDGALQFIDQYKAAL
jgi:hypothetical protein